MGQDSAGFGGDPQRGPVSPAGRAVGEMVSGARREGVSFAKSLKSHLQPFCQPPPAQAPWTHSAGWW